MFSLENELQKRNNIIAKKDELLARKEELEKELNSVNEELNGTDYNEIANEIEEIKRLMGINDVPENENLEG